LDDVRRRLPAKYSSLRTGEAYPGWLGRFILAGGKRHPRELIAEEFGALSGKAVVDVAP
jgi:hypothetical protein